MSQLASYFTILAGSTPKLWYISWLPILSLHWKLIVSYLLIIKVTVSIWVEYQVSTLNVVNIRLRFLFPIVLHCVFGPCGYICCCFFLFGNIFLLFAIKHWTINNYWMNTFFSLVWFKFWLVTFFPELYVIVKSYLSFVVLITLLTHFPCISLLANQHKHGLWHLMCLLAANMVLWMSHFSPLDWTLKKAARILYGFFNHFPFYIAKDIFVLVFFRGTFCYIYRSTFK